VSSPSSFKVALACGPSGAYVDISNWLESEEDFTYKAGRESGFDDTLPGEFSFAVTNKYGLFTPANVPTLFLATTLVSAASAGATSFSSTASIPAGSFVVLDTGATSELVVTAGVSGSGPYTVTLAAETSLAFAHSSGVAVSPMTTVTEQMGVSWLINSRLTGGAVQTVDPMFPSGEPAWALVRLVCDDALGNMGRVDVSAISSPFIAATTTPYWYCNAPDLSRAALFDPVSRNQLAIKLGSIGAVSDLGSAQVVLSAGGSIYGSSMPIYRFTAATYTVGVTPSSLASDIWEIKFFTSGSADKLSLSCASGVLTLTLTDVGAVLTSTATMPMPSTFTLFVVQASVISTSPLTYTYTLSACNASGTSTISVTLQTATLSNGAQFAITATSGGVGFSDLSHSIETGSSLGTLVKAFGGVESDRISLITALVSGISISTLPSGLSTAQLGVIATSGQSALDAMNDVIRTEQGYLSTTTTGSLTSPAQKVLVRERTRPATVSYSFNVGTEGIGDPEFKRSITNLVSAVTVNGANDASRYITDSTLTTRAGGKNTDLTVLTTAQSDLYEAGTDLIRRGAITKLVPTAFTVDARLTPTDRLNDLLGATLGDRIQLTGLPSTQLGVSTFDGWLVGRSEIHTTTENLFTLYLDPCTSNDGILDTDRFMGDTALTLSSSITSSATSMSVATTDTTNSLLALTGAGTPYDLQIGIEQVTVTACTSATPQVLTITRGANGTTATAHTAGDAIEIATPDYFNY
jgi:hypothetical protein